MTDTAQPQLQSALPAYEPQSYVSDPVFASAPLPLAEPGLESEAPEQLPPPYPISLPASFPVGSISTAPVVNIEQLQAHLRILAAFHALRQQVSSASGDLSAETAWAIFLARAVHRFKLWVQHVLPMATDGGELADELISPLDVLMVWHTYCLNPRTYYEDSIRLYPSLLALRAFPTIRIAALIDPISCTAALPIEARRASFEIRTSEPFVLPLTTNLDESLRVSCPHCPNKVTQVQWITENGKGYSQPGFIARCEYCKQLFNRDAMCVRRFCEDVVQQRDSDTFYMAGTLLDPQSGEPNTKDAKRINKTVLAWFIKGSILKTLSAPDMARAMKFQMAHVISLCGHEFQGLENLPKRVVKVMACYGHPEPFSIELTGAILRQGRFIQKMHDLGWTNPSLFSGPAGAQVLVRTVARYHAFLDVMTGGVTFLVPTLDIDLAWHTHQLNSAQYRTQTTALLGRTPNHDDKVDESALSTSFDYTARAWKDRFGVDYTGCGCPPPPPPAPDSKAAAVTKTFGKLSLFKSAKAKPAAAPPPPPPRMDLLPTNDDEGAKGTHPSEHNSMLILNRGIALATREKQKKEEEKSKGKGKAGSGSNGPKVKVEQEVHSQEGHGKAFSVPVPYWGVTTFGDDGYGDEGMMYESNSRCATGIGGGVGACTPGGCTTLDKIRVGAGCGCGGCGG